MDQKRMRATKTESSSLPVAAIVAISGLAVLFLLWLIYVHPPPQGFATRLLFLPALNALLNAFSATALATGYFFIRRRRIAAHRALMITAFVFSSLFLVCYIVNHALHGEMRFPGHGPERTVYLSILISHVFLSVVALPMVLTSFFFSLTGRFPQHKNIARVTFPIWLYVSVTGVVVYAMLAAWR
jgi:putative membrane protein